VLIKWNVRVYLIFLHYKHISKCKHLTLHNIISYYTVNTGTSIIDLNKIIENKWKNKWLNQLMFRFIYKTSSLKIRIQQDGAYLHSYLLLQYFFDRVGSETIEYVLSTVIQSQYTYIHASLNEKEHISSRRACTPCLESSCTSARRTQSSSTISRTWSSTHPPACNCLWEGRGVGARQSRSRNSRWSLLYCWGGWECRGFSEMSRRQPCAIPPNDNSCRANVDEELL